MKSSLFHGMALSIALVGGCRDEPVIPSMDRASVEAQEAQAAARASIDELRRPRAMVPNPSDIIYCQVSLPESLRRQTAELARLEAQITRVTIKRNLRRSEQRNIDRGNTTRDLPYQELLAEAVTAHADQVALLEANKRLQQRMINDTRASITQCNNQRDH